MNFRPSPNPCYTKRDTFIEDPETIITSLRTQLQLQTELCTQYDKDLRARDELVALLFAASVQKLVGSSDWEVLSDWQHFRMHLVNAKE